MLVRFGRADWRGRPMTAQPKVAELQGKPTDRRREDHQFGPALRRQPRRLHLGRARSDCPKTTGSDLTACTATSAGGVNAVVLADGLALNGREERTRTIAWNFWKKMSEVA